MKTTDLMIEDWVKYTTPAYIKVASITKRRIGYHIKPDEPRLNYVRVCEIGPIPLTPEILEKNFENEGNIFGYKDYKLNHDFTLENRGERFSLVRICNDFTSSTFWICDILYVHELQHALKLCNIVKEIVL